ncbi:hypothetical protein PHYBLDRAFT_165368 [Phycomyces blakesleeanus NRRL 1555(-)]|uniref:Homeodomain-like DNA binding domain-containing transcription factor n=1 Tax=Phycomyces blakesleeanus (strain ATCC 8743b / DSM 1359 / FGSC 10004 / NBRC 33097 / NRRL 1555) TaxID=763407 RepID=A0A162XWG5_PHYB8|nr:hypothetical protein PHYBLDRAFT_152013 [Phycomyces blakesleeanus NRRL 1555(-)]XP_018294905.1 hypothetical protein PHYBLDRAFT_165368 [Phycomyces blakesleeanus NRRL 1555(-)]OAD66742.1 hypothetical protein PHYBLDRAFT_152013 [Phycomyces blakesleeanus NRRL 1555(-)]OAD76865.1 hypothetical protein PHYBLDRAFT_165368 [Phycomyces blakesleeanus NRRL 1555(-)]|eukprot:XP_018284782.1 hypothetical protein PHYBLDRAFT_152013 [Phycomyces blakesleeanus NRRL 1555(-)]
MSNQNESYPTRRTPAEREMTNSLAILRRDMTTVMKDVADIKAKTSNTPVSAVLQSQPMALVHAVAPVSMEMNVAGSSTMASDAKSVNKTKAYRLLREHLWDPKFKSKHLAEIQANNGKPRWNTAVNFNQSPNTELTENLVAYLERNFVGAGLRKSDVRDFVYTNFTSRKRAANKSQAKKKSDNARNRRSSREKEHLKRRKTAYQSNKTAIDDEMKRDCSGLIIEEAMSVGESDDGTSPHVSYSGLRLRRPGWRSDEYNHFITLVDNKVVADLGLNSHQLLSRAFGETVEGPVPDAIASQFPQWALRNGP